MIKINHLKFIGCFLCLLCMVTLAACSSSDDEAILEGERISILDFEKQLKPDAEFDKSKLKIADPIENNFWPGPDGYSTNLMKNLAFEGGKKMLWERPLGYASKDSLPLLAKPIIVNGSVFAMDLDGVLTKFDLETGMILWTVRVNPRDETDPTLGGGVVFSGNKLFVATGYNEVMALSPVNGGLIWRFKTPAPVRSAPTVLGNRVFVVMADSKTIALDTDDGSVIWRHEGTPEKIGVVGASSPAANRSLVVIPYSSGELHALRMENGKQLWSQDLSRGFGFQNALSDLKDIQAAPVMEGGLIFAMNYSGTLAAIVQRTGSRIWQQKVGGINTPWVSGDFIFVISDENIVYALHKISGKVLWLQQLDLYEDPEYKDGPIVWRGPLMAGSKLYVASSHGIIKVLDPYSGDVETSYDLGRGIAQSPVVAGGIMLVVTDNGLLRAYK